MISPRTLVEALLPFAGELALAQVYGTAAQAGLDDQPVRLALRRMIGAGEIVQRGRGRGGSVELTAAGRDRLGFERSALRLAIDQDAGRAPWDGSWHLYAVSAPESERASRDAIRRWMAELGAAPVSTSLYLSAHDLQPLLPQDFEPHLVTATATTLTVRGRSDPRDIVEALWPAEPIRAAHEALAMALDDDDASAAPLVRKLRLADALDVALRADPLIPAELRAEPWRPAAVRRRWRERWASIPNRGGEPDVFAGWLPTDLRAG